MGANTTTNQHSFASRIPTLIATVGIAAVIVIVFGVITAKPLFEADLSTYVLPAVARADGLGVVYADYLDIKPPLVFGVFVPWFALFGPSLVGVWILYALLMVALLAGFWVALRQQLRPWLALTLFTFSLLVALYYVILDDIPFATEVPGVTLVLWGLVLARWKSESTIALFFAAVFLGLAGQFKDVFLLVPIALLPLVWRSRSRSRAFASVVGGVAAAVVLTASMLLWWGEGALGGYFDALGIKRERFPARPLGDLVDALIRDFYDAGHWLPYLGLFVLTVIVIVLATLIHIRSGEFGTAAARNLAAEEWMILVAFGAVFVLFLWQRSEMRQYYAIAVLFLAYLVLAVGLSHAIQAASWMPRAPRIAVTVLLIAGLAPPLASFTSAAGRAYAVTTVPFAERARAAESKDLLSSFAAVRRLAGSEGCLHVAYGWGATVTYLYTGLPPCTRFTLPPLVAQTPGLAPELRDALVANPPRVLIVDPDDLYPDEPVLPFEEIARSCFEPSEIGPPVYVRKADTRATSACIAAQTAALE